MKKGDHDYTRERLIRDILDKYRKPGQTITGLTVAKNIQRGLYYNIIDSRVFPARESLVYFMVTLNFSSKDCVELMQLKGYVFPFTAAEVTLFEAMKEKEKKEQGKTLKAS